MLSWLIGNGLLVKENHSTIAVYFNSFHTIREFKMDDTMEEEEFLVSPSPVASPNTV